MVVKSFTIIAYDTYLTVVITYVYKCSIDFSVFFLKCEDRTQNFSRLNLMNLVWNKLLLIFFKIVSKYSFIFILETKAGVTTPDIWTKGQTLPQAWILHWP